MRQYIYRVSGITLDESKDYLIETRLSDLLALASATTYATLVERASADVSGRLRSKIVDAITTGETQFFRDVAPFDLLKHKILPEWVDRNRGNLSAPLRIWCAAASSGQEIYSIAIVLKELFGDLSRTRARILGTDISDEAIARSSAGVYTSLEIARGLTPLQRDRHFKPVSGGWKVSDEIRSIAHFRRYNLLDDLGALGRFDIVFCRNVAIYFNEVDRKRLFERIARQMDPPGCLVIGNMESLGNSVPALTAERYLRTVYYRLS